MRRVVRGPLARLKHMGRFRHHSAAAIRRPSAHPFPALLVEHEISPLSSSRVFQSTAAADRKNFHCSICKKSFRLEMAAKVHLAQAHNGEGTIEAGAGPGVAAEAVKPAVPLTHAPPTQPTPKPAVLSKDEQEDEEAGYKSNRPAPTPLHKPDAAIPPEALDEMIAVWDKIGLSRLDSFVHSTMVMKVFAAKQVAKEDLPKSFEVDVAPDGDNPFAALSFGAPASGLSKASTLKSAEGSQGNEELAAPYTLHPYFAVASDMAVGPFEPAAVSNPFAPTSSSTASSARTAAPPKAVPAAAPPTADVPRSAPVTPYGQLPMFGAAAEAAATVSSNPPPSTDSPFAATEIASPFVADGNAAVSPFAASPFAAASPFGSTAASPFAASSPFGAPGDAPSFAASPFGASTTSMATNTEFQFQPPMSSQGSDPSLPPSAINDKKLICAQCGKAFRDDFDLAQHMKGKHKVDMPVGVKPKSAKRKLPELPAYVPSPVDLSATSPFGSSDKPNMSWAEMDLQVHAASVSNTTIVGQVLTTEFVAEGGANHAQLMVHIPATRDYDEETIAVRCHGDGLVSYVKAHIKRNSSVLVMGSLRLHPTLEASLNKYFTTPIVHVSQPSGSLVLLE